MDADEAEISLAIIGVHDDVLNHLSARLPSCTMTTLALLLPLLALGKPLSLSASQGK